MYDVVIIGAGVTGCSVARELARTQRKIAVLEKEGDVCEGTSKANSGIVHAGYDASPGTLKAKLNVLGNEKMEQLAKDLDFPFQRNGSMVLCFEEEGKAGLEELLQRGRENGVKELRILTREEVLKLEPNISGEVKAALYAPTGGIVCPFGMNIALAENACANGVEMHLHTKVEGIEKATDADGGIFYKISTAKGVYETKLLVNAAGVYSDEIHNMVCSHKIHITPRRGEYCLMDKKTGNLIKSTIFQLPSRLGKGILVTPSVHGNLLVGPTAENIENKEGTNTTAEGLEKVMESGRKSVPALSGKWIITSFAGLRAHEAGEDFIIGEAEDAPGFWDVAGIGSPGLSCTPVIGEYVAAQIQQAYPAPLKETFIAVRQGIPNMAEASEEERKQLIAQNPAYANVVCRCELVTEGEIVEAIHRTPGATTLDGIKRRTRTGMGRCQAGFCAPKTVEILARELGIEASEITKSGEGSQLLFPSQ